MSRIFLHLAQRCWRLTLLALAVATLALPAGLAAQTSTGAVRGYVRDQSATPVVDAQVAARSLDMGVTRTTTTNPSGFYNLGGLRPGRYELTVRRLGYSAQTRTVTVQIGQTLGVDLQMNAAAVSLQAVRVVAETEVETRTSEVGTNVSREQIRDLPTVERNILDLAKLVPGITATAPNSQDKFLAAGGQPAEAVNIFVDGATYKNDVLKGGVAGQDASKGNPFPQSAVQEFRILTQNYKAEYQKASSAIITATTRSGTNHWEGDAFLFGIARSYVARDAKAVERNEARPNYERVQGGGSIGGPIIPNKLFVFGTYELNYREQPAYVRAGADSLLAPASLNWRALQGQEISQFKQHLAFGKVSWIKTARSTIDASANVRYENDYRSFGGVNAGNDWTREAAENVKIKVYNGVGNWRYAGDRWLNEAQVNLQHFVWNPVPDNPDVIGREYIGILRTGGRDTEQRFTQNRLSLRNDVTRSDVTWLGDHVFKGGASVDFLGYEGVKYTAGNPIYKLRKDENYARPFEAFFGFGDPKINRSNQQIGLYLQDDWNPTPKLTFNLGLRWDVETNGINNDYVTPSGLADSLRTTYAPQLWVNQPVLRANGTCCDTRQVRVIDQLGGIDRYVTSGRSDRPIYWGAIQPRLGASFDFFGDGSTVAFGGFGIYYDRNYWNTLFDEQYRRQYLWTTVQFNDVGPTPNCARCVRWEDRLYQPEALRSLGHQRPEVFLVANDMKPPKTHQTTFGVRQMVRGTQVSVSYNGIRGFNGMNYVRAWDWGGLGNDYAVGFVTDDRVKTWYDALQVQVQKPMRGSTRWGGGIAYTLSKAEEQGQSTDIFWGWDDHYPTVGERPRMRAPGDQRHAVVANGIVRLPYDVRLSSILTLGSGITSNATDATAGWDYGKQRLYPYTPPGRSFLGVGRAFNTQNVDVRVEKELALWTGQTVGLVADLYNAANTAQWGCYDATIRPSTDTPNPNYDVPGCAGPGRRLQLGLRYGVRAEPRQ